MRKLSLHREVLQELTADELARVVGGTRETLYSCLDYVSCDITQCVLTVE